MGKVRFFFQNLSLRKSIVHYITAFAFLGVLLSALTASYCNIQRTRIHDSYPIAAEKYYLTTESGQRLGNGTYIGTDIAQMSPRDERRMALLGAIPVIATPLYSSLCILAAALLFYRNKLKKPLGELKAASEKISRNDLDFSLSYQNQDELGQLCDSFETMRDTLAKNFTKMWRQVEERKQLNAAFAHDLRTPLTVLKGYNEMLQASTDITTQEAAVTMGHHIQRLERYIDSMSRLRRLEDSQPDYKETPSCDLSSMLKESAEILCLQEHKNLCFQNHISPAFLVLDRDFILQVCGNLVSNAVRYAKTTITLTLEKENEGVLLSVSDDGKGFSEETLRKAVQPYFTEEENHFQHFGLGLYICKLLCAHHGGGLKLENQACGGKVTAFFKSPSL